MKKKIAKGMIATTGVLLVTGGILLGANVLEQTNDLTPPYGRLVVSDANEVNSVNYTNRTSVTIQIYAKDDICEDNEIKYYISTSPISNTEKLDASLWKNYYEGVTETIELPSLTSTNTVYAIFKDKAGNTSTIYTGSETAYTITYDANGGTGAPEPQTAYFGMPFNVSSQRPTREGKYFMGWSEVQGSTMADYEGYEIYEQDSIIAANSFTSDDVKITLYAVWTDQISDLATLAESVNIGDYVNYPVYYDNVYTSSNNQYKASLKGWRVLSVDVDLEGNASPGTVNLVSAGVPLTYYHSNSSETSIKNLAINFLKTPFDTVANNTYRKTGFNPYLTLTEVFDNKYTARYSSGEVVSYTSTYSDGKTQVTYTGTKAEGDLKVRSMTKEDLDTVYGSRTLGGLSLEPKENYGKLLAIPSEDMTGKYARYWLASANSGFYLWNVNENGSVNSSYSDEFGVRPVVSLKSTVKTSGKNIVGAWDIEIAE